MQMYRQSQLYQKNSSRPTQEITGSNPTQFLDEESYLTGTFTQRSIDSQDKPQEKQDSQHQNDSPRDSIIIMIDFLSLLSQLAEDKSSDIDNTDGYTQNEVGDGPAPGQRDYHGDYEGLSGQFQEEIYDFEGWNAVTIVVNKDYMEQLIEICSTKQNEPSKNTQLQPIRPIQVQDKSQRASKFDDQTYPNDDDYDVGYQLVLIWAVMIFIIEYGKFQIYFISDRGDLRVMTQATEEIEVPNLFLFKIEQLNMLHSMPLLPKIHLLSLIQQINFLLTIFFQTKSLKHSLVDHTDRQIAIEVLGQDLSAFSGIILRSTGIRCHID